MDKKIESLKIRKGIAEDIEVLSGLYDNARKFMHSKGNMNQWTGGYPSAEILLSDIEKGNLYVVEDSTGVVHGAFAFIIGEDPTYSYIEGGRWLDDEKYGTIHRIVSSGNIRGLADHCINYCLDLTGNVRIDTHEDNFPMRNVIERNGFTHCGVIYIADGSPRLAYHRILHR